MSSHAVILEIPLCGEFGAPTERRIIDAYLKCIESLVETRKAENIELDGHEFGNGACTIYLYGPNADELFGIVEKSLNGSSLNRRIKVTRRYGDVSDRSANEIATFHVVL